LPKSSSYTIVEAKQQENSNAYSSVRERERKRERERQIERVECRRPKERKHETSQDTIERINGTITASVLSTLDVLAFGIAKHRLLYGGTVTRRTVSGVPIEHNPSQLKPVVRVKQQ
jgi:hypothetical protein